MFYRLTTLVFVASMALLGGCASVPMADPTQDTAAKAFTAPKDKAGVYIYRSEAFGAAMRMDVFLNGRKLGESASKTYFYVELPPGTHSVVGKSENDSEVRFQALAGRLYYIWQEVKMGLLYARNELKLVDEQTGRAGVLESKRVSSSQ